MKSLNELREVFVAARNLALEEDVSRIAEVIKGIDVIASHCKELYDSTEYPLERAKCKNLCSDLDSVKNMLLANGYQSDFVRRFFGLPAKKVVVPETPIDSMLGGGNASSDAPAASADSGTDDIASYLGGAAKPYEPIEHPIDVVPVNGAPEAEQPVVAADGGDDLVSIIEPDIPALANVSEEPEIPALANVSEEPEIPALANVSDTPEEPAPNGVIPTPGDALEPQSLDEYIGQEHIVKRIKEEIEAAKILGRKHLDNIMLFGNRGLGKSTLIELIAKEMGVELHFVDCTTFANNSKSEENFHNFFLNIINMDRPVVIAFDEIHALTPKLQSRLLTLLQKRAYAYMVDGITRTVPVNDFTFIGATTDYDAVLNTIKDRCTNLTFTMKDYNRDELSRILVNKFAAMGLTANDDVITCCVNRFRNSLRDIKAIVMGIHTKAVIKRTNEVTLSMAEEYFKERGIDPIGLEEVELKILRIIRDDERGSISEDTLAARAYLDPKVLTKVHEPYLMKIGFISINSKGRSLTPKAEDYLKYGYYDFGDGVYIGTNPKTQGKEDGGEDASV